MALLGAEGDPELVALEQGGLGGEEFGQLVEGLLLAALAGEDIGEQEGEAGGLDGIDLAGLAVAFEGAIEVVLLDAEAADALECLGLPFFEAFGGPAEDGEFGAVEEGDHLGEGGLALAPLAGVAAEVGELAEDIDAEADALLDLFGLQEFLEEVAGLGLLAEQTEAGGDGEGEGDVIGIALQHLGAETDDLVAAEELVVGPGEGAHGGQGFGIELAGLFQKTNRLDRAVGAEVDESAQVLVECLAVVFLGGVEDLGGSDDAGRILPGHLGGGRAGGEGEEQKDDRGGPSGVETSGFHAFFCSMKPDRWSEPGIASQWRPGNRTGRVAKVPEGVGGTPAQPGRLAGVGCGGGGCA